ncbi:hypothetical protein ACS0TY_021382 [Phlomoides rotata]
MSWIAPFAIILCGLPFIRYTLCPIILGSSADKDGLFADHEDVKSISYLLIS